MDVVMNPEVVGAIDKDQGLLNFLVQLISYHIKEKFKTEVNCEKYVRMK